ncbi:hypothetical protein OK074_5039 [Actinobacteria bacterium OK074]|nr:hypothetical protein OK074_5039 [Actinobacteria bacterium OK074]
MTFRGYCLEQVAAAYDVVLISPSAPSWERMFIVDHESADPADPQQLIAAGRALARRHPIAGVLTWTEWHLVPTALLTEALGHSTVTAQTMRACRDKAAARRRFAQAGVPSARSIAVASPDEAADAADTIGYPVVLKPSQQAASLGVIRVDARDQLDRAWPYTAHAANSDASPGRPGILVEEYLDGPEISVECVTHQGVTTAVAVTRKSLGPYFQETAHSVDASDPLLPQAAPVAVQAVQALGITSGVQHVELRLTDRGPRIIEVNARIGGDLIGRLVHLATGIDLPRAAADTACGRTPDLRQTRHRAAAIKLLYPPASGRLTARHLTPAFAAHTPWLHQIHWLHDLGEQITLPPQGDMFTARAGFFIVTARDTAQAAHRVQLVTDEIHLAISPTGRT